MTSDSLVIIINIPHRKKNAFYQGISENVI